ncbi:MAG: hypothetical protein DRI97_15000 [Bacteroidetes bacterium]|nr:MAG: hypothetical protein DRI97_15000 [Bacteroidota bacterium]
MARVTIFFCTLLIPLVLWAQEPEYLEFVKSETRLQQLFSRLYTDSLSDVDAVLDTIRIEMTEALSMQGSMDFPWMRLDKIGIITSEDNRLRIFTWHIMDDFDHYRYFGFIQVGMKKGKSRLYELKDNNKLQRGVMKLDQSREDWYGKLYYQVLTNQYKRKTYYTLLGMDFNSSRSIIKSVEVIALQRNAPHFERSLFFNGRDKVDRLVLEYSSQVAISVRYDQGTDMITFDHLVPFHPIYENNFEFYGPDGSIDGLEFSGGIWNYQDDIDARNLD